MPPLMTFMNRLVGQLFGIEKGRELSALVESDREAENAFLAQSSCMVQSAGQHW